MKFPKFLLILEEVLKDVRGLIDGFGKSANYPNKRLDRFSLIDKTGVM